MHVSPGLTGAATTSYGYDLNGNVATVTYPVGQTYRFNRDRAGRLTGSAIAFLGWWPMSTVRYNDDGTPDSEALYGNHSRKWLYPANGAHQPTSYTQSIANTSPATTTATELTWRADGRLGVDDTLQAGSAPSDTTTFYDYDPAGQIICVARVDNPDPDPDCPETPTTDCDDTIGVDTWLYVYGPRGERLCQAAEGDVTAYTWNTNAELETSDDGTTTNTYTYDPEGRRTSRDFGDPDKIVQWHHDPRGLPTSIRVGETGCEPGGTPDCVGEQTRDYDAAGQLVALGGGGVNFAFTWDDTRPVPEIIQARRNGGIWTTLTYNIHRFHHTDPAEGSGYFAYDAHGNTLKTSLNSGADRYDPYGTPINPNTLLFFGYRGELHTPDDYNIHLRNRDYNPQTGTFTTRDPLDGVNGTATIANPYHYSDNDPTNGIDPLGLRPCMTFECKYARPPKVMPRVVPIACPREGELGFPHSWPAPGLLGLGDRLPASLYDCRLYEFNKGFQFDSGPSLSQSFGLAFERTPHYLGIVAAQVLHGPASSPQWELKETTYNFTPGGQRWRYTRSVQPTRAIQAAEFLQIFTNVSAVKAVEERSTAYVEDARIVSPAAAQIALGRSSSESKSFVIVRKTVRRSEVKEWKRAWLKDFGLVFDWEAEWMDGQGYRMY